MGYYTDFSLTVTGDKALLDGFNKEVSAGLINFYNDYYDIKEILNGTYNGKWYDYEDEMKSLSEKFPNLLFVLTGYGEESGDIWKAWFRNGKGVKVAAEITCPEPDLENLLPMISYDADKVNELKQKKLKLEEELEQVEATIKSLAPKLDKR